MNLWGEPTGQPVSRRVAALVLLMGIFLSWLTGTFTGSGLNDLLTASPTDMTCDTAAATGCWWEWFRGPDYAGIARVLRTAGFVALTLFIGTAAVSRRDRALLQAAILLSLVGDIFLVLVPMIVGVPEAPIGGVPPEPSFLQKNSFLIGVGVFLVVHVVLIVRHLKGLRASFQGPGAERARKWTIGLGVFWFTVAAGVVAIWWELLDQQPTAMLVVFLIYILVLAAGVWAGTTVLFRAPFGDPDEPPYVRLNAALIGGGMVCYGVTDVTLGLEHLYRSGETSERCWQIITIIKDLNYSPALMFLAYSGFVWFAKGQTVRDYLEQEQVGGQGV
ncbi:lysoplasmalogenase family protein [Myxococcota bacterium]|nr:lysoplasmalogenase family protein [Myxococcota bacterium]